jgi:hypothetical protein
VRCQEIKLGLLVIPAQAGIHTWALDFRLRGNDGCAKSLGFEPKNPNSIVWTMVV